MSTRQFPDLDAGRLRELMGLLADHPELDAAKLRALVEQAGRRRRKPDPLQPRSYADLTGAVAAGWMTKNEARKLAGLIQRPGPQRKAAQGAL